MQLLMDRMWTCPENGDAGVGVGLGVGDCSTGELPETIQTSALQLPEESWTPAPARHQPQPRPIPAPPHTNWAPPHFDSFLPGGGDLYPSLQLVRCVGSLKYHSGSVVALGHP